MYRVTNISGNRQNRGAVFVEPMISGRLLKIGRSTVVSDDYYEKHGATLRTLVQQQVLRIDTLGHAQAVPASQVADEAQPTASTVPALSPVDVPTSVEEVAPPTPEDLRGDELTEPPASEFPGVVEAPKKKGKKGKVD